MIHIQDTPQEATARDDRRLVELMVRGRDDAVEALYDRYAVRAHRVARSVCRDERIAEDAVQEAFLSVWRGREAYRPEIGSFATWLLAIVRNRAIDLSRRNGRHADRRADAELLDEEHAAGDVATEAVANADAPRLRALLAELPDAQQEVIVLAYFGQLSHSEIAHLLNLPAGTVKGRMRLGLRKLRADIDQAVA